MYTFNPPTVDEGIYHPNLLIRRMKLSRGISILKIDGQYYETRSPSMDEVNEADIFYQGGRTYTVTDSEAADLQAAGYEVVAL